MKTEKQVKHNTKIKVYPDGRLHLTCFTRDVFRDDGWEYIYDDVEIKETSEHVEYDTSNPTRSDSLKRAKGKIFDIALSNEWEYMITLTLDSKKVDRYDPQEIIKPFKKWLQNMVFRYGMKYLIVPELHEDGAIHFHGLVKSDSLELIDSGTVKVPDKKKPIKIETAKRLKIPPSKWRTVFNIKSYTLGFSSAVRIDNNVEAVSKYMTKYTCKNFQKIFGKSFFAGGGVNRELPTFFLDVPYVRLEAEEFRLPDNLGGVKYLTLDQSTFDLLLKQWSY